MIKRLALIGFIFTFLISCTEDAFVHTRNVVVVLVDYSKSRPIDEFENYIDVISNFVVMNLSENDYITILPIDEGSSTEAKKILEIDLSKIQFNKDSDGYYNARDSLLKRKDLYLEEIKFGLSEILLSERENRSRFVLNTDIFSALGQAGIIHSTFMDDEYDPIKNYVMSKHSLVNRKVTLVFSDMINESYVSDFSRDFSCDNSLHSQVLNAYEELSFLKDTDIFVYGRTADNSSQLIKIQNCWESIFDKIGLNLIAYDFDTKFQISSYFGGNSVGWNPIITNSEVDKKILGEYIGIIKIKNEDVLVRLNLKEIKTNEINGETQIIYDLNSLHSADLNQVGFYDENKATIYIGDTAELKLESSGSNKSLNGKWGNQNGVQLRGI